MFRSKPEAYTSALITVHELKKDYSEAKELEHAIEQIKIAFENHEQDPQVVCEILQKIIPAIDPKDQRLSELIQQISTSNYTQSARAKFEAPLSRRYESEVAIKLLREPTKAMMEAVGEVSKQILSAIKNQGMTNNHIFLSTLTAENRAEGCGGFDRIPTLGEVTNILKNNHPSRLAEIMHIHYKFCRGLMDDGLGDTPVRPPVGKLKDIVESLGKGPPEEFFKRKLNNTYLKHIDRDLFYNGPLYTVEHNRRRGRDGRVGYGVWNRLGIMLRSQQDFYYDLPTLGNYWKPDVINQEADLTSPYVTDLIDNDTTYVSGPSGMLSLYMGHMEFGVNFPTVRQKQNYLTACVAYIVGGGFHSIHEVIGPAQYVLDLVPGYEVSVPSHNKKAKPPNFNVFYQQQVKNDVEFAERREQSWENYLNFFKQIYLKKYPRLAFRLVMLQAKLPQRDQPECSQSTSPVFQNEAKELVPTSPVLQPATKELAQASPVLQNDAKELPTTLPVQDKSEIAITTKQIKAKVKTNNYNFREEVKALFKWVIIPLAIASAIVFSGGFAAIPIVGTYLISTLSAYSVTLFLTAALVGLGQLATKIYKCFPNKSSDKPSGEANSSGAKGNSVATIMKKGNFTITPSQQPPVSRVVSNDKTIDCAPSKSIGHGNDSAYIPTGNRVP